MTNATLRLVTAPHNETMVSSKQLRYCFIVHTAKIPRELVSGKQVEYHEKSKSYYKSIIESQKSCFNRVKISTNDLLEIHTCFNVHINFVSTLLLIKANSYFSINTYLSLYD
ncbi:hypothetical protein Hanom_Chr10g00963481 [Helianthus anomalus]